MGEHRWKSSISKVEPNKILLRGYRIDGLMGRLGYAEAVYLAIMGELPGETEGRMIDAILVSSIDHGVTPPSTLAAITAASTGSPINAAIAAGVLAISRHHGGAIEGCMRFLGESVDRIRTEYVGVNVIAQKVVQEYQSLGKRIAGYGHLIHTQDPRTVKLFSLAEELGFSGCYVEMAKAVERALEERSGKKFPINVNGAVASILMEMGFAPELANAFFIMARLPGLVAHIQEEVARQQPLRTIDPTDAEYDGPPERKFP
jgi:citrate synthase